MTATADLRVRFPRGLALLDSVTVIESEANAYQFVSDRPFQLSGLRPRRRALLAALKQGSAWDALDALGFGPDELAIVGELDRRHLLRERVVPSPDDPQVRQLGWLEHYLPGRAEVAQETLRAQHAVVIGCGGTGSVVVQHLVSIGVRTLTLVDYDAVEISNLNRQLPYRRTDVGSPKVEALRDHVLERNPECRVETRQLRIAGVDDLLAAAAGATVIFCCADTPVGTISALVARASVRLSVPCVFGSVGLLEGSVGPLLDGRPGPASEAFVAAMEALGAVGERVVGKAAMGSSFAPVNTIVSASMVLEWAKFALALGGCQILDRSIVVDWADGSRRVEASWPLSSEDHHDSL